LDFPSGEFGPFQMGDLVACETRTETFKVQVSDVVRDENGKICSYQTRPLDAQGQANLPQGGSCLRRGFLTSNKTAERIPQAALDLGKVRLL